MHFFRFSVSQNLGKLNISGDTKGKANFVCKIDEFAKLMSPGNLPIDMVDIIGLKMCVGICNLLLRASQVQLGFEICLGKRRSVYLPKEANNA